MACTALLKVLLNANVVSESVDVDRTEFGFMFELNQFRVACEALKRTKLGSSKDPQQASATSKMCLSVWVW